MTFDFYLGVHRPSWMLLTDVPLFVSARTLRKRRTIPKALGRVAIDSAGFTELDTYGRWTIDDQQLAETVERVVAAGCVVDFAAPRDWMCEPFILAKTGKTIQEHQRLTLESYINLRAIAPSIPWIPVIQGYRVDEYAAHVEMYKQAGIDLRTLPRVGVGSVCRRQGTKDGASIINSICDMGIAVHAFGIKLDGLKLFGHRIASADSMTWSSIARRRILNLEACKQGHEPSKRRGNNCANCLRWALQWHNTRILKCPP